MRIAALVDLAPRKLGSLEQWVLEFVAECLRRGHSVHLFCQTPVHPAIEGRLKELRVSRTEYDRLGRRPYRWGRILRRSFDVVYMNLVPPRSPAAYAAYFAWPLPLFFFDGSSGSIPGGRGRSWAGRILAPLAFARVAALAGCSHYVVERDRLYFRFDAARCSVVYNGVDTSRFTPPTDGYPAVPNITTTAYLIPEKGIDILIEACALLQDLPWRLVIIGDGPEEERLRERVARSGLGERTAFLGLRDDVETMLRTAEIHVHPALWEEAFGLTIIEGMASGCATVASRVGGIPEIIEDGRSGLLFNRGDSKALAEALRGLLSAPALRRELGKAARTRVVEQFGLRAAVEGQVDWIERSWLSERGRNPKGRPPGAISDSRCGPVKHPAPPPAHPRPD